MVELKTAEHVIHYMISNVKLSRYDEKFIANLQGLKQVTTNQVELFYRIIFKYRRQLAKDELYAEKLIELPWTMPVVESVAQYTDGFVIIENSKILFRCPYNRNFIKQFRDTEFNPFKWDKEKRQYEADYGENTLKFLVNSTINHFKHIHYCDETKKLLGSLHQYKDEQYWNPTLTLLNDRYYLVACNQHILDAIADIELNNDVKTLAKLTQYGVTIDNKLYDNNDERMRFITNNIVEVEVSQVINMASWLKEIGCDLACIRGPASFIKKQFTDELDKLNIKHTDTNIFIVDSATFDTAKFPVFVSFRTIIGPLPKGMSKIIRLVNSQPVDIK